MGAVAGVSVPAVWAAGGSGKNAHTDPLQGYHKVWEKPLPINGDVRVTPPLSGGRADRYRVAVTGLVDTGGTGMVFDGRFHTDMGGKFRVGHGHLRVETPGVRLLESDRVRHRYVFGFVDETIPKGRTVTVRFAGLAYRLRISPARLMSRAKSTLKLSLWKKGPAPRGGAALSRVLWGILIAGLVGLGLFLVQAARCRVFGGRRG